MFTQFFGSFLLSKQFVTREQLLEALRKLPECRLKLGTLGINAGFLTATQVEEIHAEQSRVDKKFGEIAKQKGYLNDTQISTLLCAQPTNHLLLGQTLIDMGVMNDDRFEFALNSYKRQYYLTDADFTNAHNAKIENTIKDFYHLGDTTENKLFVEYLMLLYKNLIRFIGADFTPLRIEKKDIIEDAKHVVLQSVKGEFNTLTGITACDDEKILIEFAKRYSGEDNIEDAEYAYECVSEFLNVNNGLFTINVSDNLSLELELTPPDNQEVDGLRFKNEVLCVPVYFTFGIVKFVLAPHDICL